LAGNFNVTDAMLSELSESVPLGDNVIVNFTLWPGHALHRTPAHPYGR
jgi:hypothetical protein